MILTQQTLKQQLLPESWKQVSGVIKDIFHGKIFHLPALGILGRQQGYLLWLFVPSLTCPVTPASIPAVIDHFVTSGSSSSHLD